MQHNGNVVGEGDGATHIVQRIFNQGSVFIVDAPSQVVEDIYQVLVPSGSPY